ncbi:MAG: hypothetical protein ACQEWM_06900 [Actinomycetota bacterium]
MNSGVSDAEQGELETIFGVTNPTHGIVDMRTRRARRALGGR